MVCHIMFWNVTSEPVNLEIKYPYMYCFDIWWNISVIVVSTNVIPLVAEIPTSGHSNSINYYLIPLKILFDEKENTHTSCSVDQLICVFLLHGLNSLPSVVLFSSPVPLKLYSNSPNFLPTTHVICPRSQWTWSVHTRHLCP